MDRGSRSAKGPLGRPAARVKKTPELLSGVFTLRGERDLVEALA
jgi:hypothetical protein